MFSGKKSKKWILDCRYLKMSERRLCSIILRSDQVLRDFPVFLNRLQRFQDDAIVAAEPPMSGRVPSAQELVSQKPVEGLLENEEEGGEEKKFALGFPLAGLLGVGIVITGVLALYDKIPSASAFYVFLIAVAAALSSQLINFVKDLLQKKEEETHELLEDWITDKLSKIRSEYTGCYQWVKGQSRDKATDSAYAESGTPEEVYVREKQLTVDLPAEFLDIIGKIMNACTKNAWLRRREVMFAIRDTKQAQAKSQP